jgi:hypothetical protein
MGKRWEPFTLSRNWGSVDEEAVYVREDIRDDPATPVGRAERAIVEYCSTHCLDCYDLHQVWYRAETDEERGHHRKLRGIIQLALVR